jgi:hypothetical protein
LPTHILDPNPRVNADRRGTSVAGIAPRAATTRWVSAAFACGHDPAVAEYRSSNLGTAAAFRFRVAQTPT